MLITTVSERYAQEILTPTFGERLDHLLRSGVIVCLVFSMALITRNNPATNSYIHTQYDAHSLCVGEPKIRRALQEAGAFAGYA